MDNHFSVGKTAFEDDADSDSQRLLRLRGEDTSLQRFQFKERLVTEEGDRRIKDFLYSLRRLPPAILRDVEGLNHRLQPMGYSLETLQHRSVNFTFERWEIK